MRRPNTTFDIYLDGALPPAAPDVAGATGHLKDKYQRGEEGSEGGREFEWTATLEVVYGTNLPDLYSGSRPATVWVPDKDGDCYTVVFVEAERSFRQLRGDKFLRAYLRKSPGGVVAITLQEQDGSPSYTGVTTLVVDQADGFVLTQPSANTARLDIAAATEAQAGIVSLAAQVMGLGRKEFRDAVRVTSPASVDTYLQVAKTSAIFQADLFESGVGQVGSFVFNYGFPSGNTVTFALANAAQPRFGVYDGATLHPGVWGALPDGSIVRGGLITSVGSGGSVTSVGLSLPSIFSVAGSPVTTTGTIAATLAAQAANVVFAGPSSGGAATPTFRALAAADLPAASDTAAGALEVAVQSEMEAASSATLAVTPARAHFHPGVCKAWANFEGDSATPTIRASYNLSSITDNGVGDWTLNWTTAFSSADYSFCHWLSNDAVSQRWATGFGLTPLAAGSARLRSADSSGASVDSNVVCAMAFGDQ